MARLALSFAASTVVALVTAQSSLQGALSDAGVFTIYPGDSGFDSASAPFNLRYDTVEPVAVTYPSTTDEVAAVVALGHSNNLNVVARSGGHSYIAGGIGSKSGELVVDLSNLTSIQYNSSSHTATIQTGLRLGDVASALGDKGQGIPHGTCPYVGIGGHAASGGFGYTSRMWGLTLDVIEEITVVMANGTVATASNNQNSDLFWAMRGAAPSFGITTSMVVKTFDAPNYAAIFQYEWDLNPSDAANFLIEYQNFLLTDIPAELGSGLVLGPWASSQDNIYLSLSGGWYGESEEALNDVLKPFLDKVPEPTSRRISGDGTYIGSVTELGGGSLNTHDAKDTTDTFYAKSLMTPESDLITLEAATAFMEYLVDRGYNSGTDWFVQPEAYGGRNSKVNSVSADSTAFGSRSSLLTFQFYASSSDMKPPYPDSAFDFVDGMVSSIVDNMPSDWAHGAYYNYPDDRLENWQELYYRDNYNQLAELKKVYDPTGVFKGPLVVAN
ncbi:Glucooligosaccharide oxidase [Cylindrobasidium torrendii FP15055 ss-10]|uniref:Glucooligosaccharide oxidase n=1 Tax=Cylindrobasidium torrendii FP15055 ss-10 TaxID=1314674 RepID=A0A0D7B362_9AGAR|nr:Glucooligosaccharide oxidase [Cylindrobasidium torrendii FP15055 ss-10]